MLGELNRGVENLLHTNLRNPIQACAHYHLDLEKLKDGDSPATNDRIIATKGLIKLKYSPAALRKYKETPFIFTNDMFKDTLIRLGGWEDYLEKAKSDEKLNFVLKYSNITPESFIIAKLNPNMDFYYSIDSIRYCKDVAKKAGTELDLSILRTPEINEAEKFKYKIFLKVNSIHDVEV